MREYNLKPDFRTRFVLLYLLIVLGLLYFAITQGRFETTGTGLSGLVLRLGLRT